MIKYINGILGGGKTALAVAYVYSVVPNTQVKKPLVKDRDFNQDYKKVYTNISGLNKEDFNGLVEFLDFDIIDKCALAQSTLLETHKHIQSIDVVLNKFWDDIADSVEYSEIETEFDLTNIGYMYEDIKGFQFNNVLIIIDEAADYFDDNKKHLVKWFTYSRHVFQDMILIQNDLGDIKQSFKNDKVVKHFILAADADFRLHPQYHKYLYYDTVKQTKVSNPSVRNIWIPKWIFTKYDTTKAEISFPVIYKYLIGMVFLIAFIIHQLSGFMSSDEVEVPSKLETHDKNNDANVDVSTLEINAGIFTRQIACFRCSKKACVYENDLFSIPRFTYYKDRYKMELAYKETYQFFNDFCYEADESFFDMYRPPPDSNSSKSSSFF